MPHPADCYCPTVTSFTQWISDHMVHGLRQGKQELFLPYGKLDQYFMQAGRLGALVEEATKPSSADLSTIQKGFIKIFTILLWIGKGPYIEHFISYPDVLSDNKLPFVDRPKHFPCRPDSDFFEAFNNAQWQFCSPLFEYERLQDTKYSDRVILPIGCFERIGNGGSAIVSKFELHPDHDLLKVGRKVPSSVSTKPLRQYVLKTFQSRDAEINYNRERAAFFLLRRHKPHPNIVCYYGSFRHSGTFNIILEYADRGDLEQYLRNTNPPSNSADIVNLWEGMSGLLLALLQIRGLQLDSAKSPCTMIGFHQDIKPSNIFLISGKTESPYEVQLKIGDFGTAHFTQATSEGEVIAISAHGTHMYAPPESHISDPAQNHTNLPVTPSVDIWSLGCLYHEVLVWTVFGYKQLLAYRRERMVEAASFGIDDGECFHKRYDVLRAVKSMSEHLRSETKRRGGYNTNEILDIIEDMIVIDPSKRKSPKSLYDKLKTIMFESRAALQKSQASGVHGSATYRRLTDCSGTPAWHPPPCEPRSGEYTQPYPLPPEGDENGFFDCPMAPATSNKRTYRASANTPTTFNEEQTNSRFHMVPATDCSDYANVYTSALPSFQTPSRGRPSASAVQPSPLLRVSRNTQSRRTKKRPAHWGATLGFDAPLNHMSPPYSSNQRICHPPTSATAASAGQAFPHDRRWRLQPTKSDGKTIADSAATKLEELDTLMKKLKYLKR